MIITESAVKLIDRSGIYHTLKNFDEQLRDAVYIASNIEIRESFKGINKIVICGLGGSAIGGDLLRSYVSSDCCRCLPRKIRRRQHE